MAANYHGLAHDSGPDDVTRGWVGCDLIVVVPASPVPHIKHPLLITGVIWTRLPFAAAQSPYSKPSISLSPSGEIAPGTDVSISCHGPRLGMRFKMYRAGVARWHTEPAGLTAEFHIPNVRREDGGTYTCSYESLGEPPVSSPCSDPVELVVAVHFSKPSISLSPSGEIAPGTGVSISCHGPRLGMRFKMYRAGVARWHTEPAGLTAEFHIPNVRREDGGTYTCSYESLGEPPVSSPCSDPVELVVADAGSGPTGGSDPTQPGVTLAPTCLGSTRPGAPPSQDYTPFAIVRLSLAVGVLLALVLILAEAAYSWKRDPPPADPPTAQQGAEPAAQGTDGDACVGPAAPPNSCPVTGDRDSRTHTPGGTDQIHGPIHTSIPAPLPTPVPAPPDQIHGLIHTGIPAPLPTPIPAPPDQIHGCIHTGIPAPLPTPVPTPPDQIHGPIHTGIPIPLPTPVPAPPDQIHEPIHTSIPAQLPTSIPAPLDQIHGPIHTRIPAPPDQIHGPIQPGIPTPLPTPVPAPPDQIHGLIHTGIPAPLPTPIPAPPDQIHGLIHTGIPAPLPTPIPAPPDQIHGCIHTGIPAPLPTPVPTPPDQIHGPIHTGIPTPLPTPVPAPPDQIHEPIHTSIPAQLPTPIPAPLDQIHGPIHTRIPAPPDQIHGPIQPGIPTPLPTPAPAPQVRPTGSPSSSTCLQPRVAAPGVSRQEGTLIPSSLR
ncbi:unnamed protein product [Lepidochelys olivacea]